MIISEESGGGGHIQLYCTVQQVFTELPSFRITYETRHHFKASVPLLTLTVSKINQLFPCGVSAFYRRTSVLASGHAVTHSPGVGTVIVSKARELDHRE